MGFAMYLDRLTYSCSLTGMTREQASEKVKERGGQVTTTLSKSCTILVTGEKASPQKVEKAQKLGAHIMTEEEFTATL